MSIWQVAGNICAAARATIVRKRDPKDAEDASLAQVDAHACHFRQLWAAPGWVPGGDGGGGVGHGVWRDGPYRDACHAPPAGHLVDGVRRRAGARAGVGSGTSGPQGEHRWGSVAVATHVAQGQGLGDPVATGAARPALAQTAAGGREVKWNGMRWSLNGAAHEAAGRTRADEGLGLQW
eukprot:9965208-Alexandrium_andersonii.AAC.1